MSTSKKSSPKPPARKPDELLRAVAEAARAEAYDLAARGEWPSRWWVEIERLAVTWSTTREEVLPRSRKPSTLREDFIRATRETLALSRADRAARLLFRLADIGVAQGEVSAYLGCRLENATEDQISELEAVLSEIEQCPPEARRTEFTRLRATRSQAEAERDRVRSAKLAELQRLVKWYAGDLQERGEYPQSRGDSRVAALAEVARSSGQKVRERALEACAMLALHAQFDELACALPAGEGRERRSFTSLPQQVVLQIGAAVWSDELAPRVRDLALALVLVEARIGEMVGRTRKPDFAWKARTVPTLLSRHANTVRTTVSDLREAGAGALFRIRDDRQR